MECLAYCIAQTIDLTRLDNHVKTNLSSLYVANRTRDVLRLNSVSLPPFTIFVFKNGTVVSWGLKRYRIDDHLNRIRPFADKQIPRRVRDQCIYTVGDKTLIEPHDFFDVDCLTIEADNDELKLSLSYGFSQSVKLQYFETIMEGIIEKYSPVIQHLSHTGKMPIARNAVRQIIGEILGAKSEMNLISNFMYHPKYFWQHPTLEEYYAMLERYLHVQRRVNAINHRLDTLNEIFDMFNGYLENRHAHLLEIVVIILITLEVVLSLFSIFQ